MSTTVVVDTDVVSYLFKSHPTAVQCLRLSAMYYTSSNSSQRATILP
jgi:hypothetical protein